MKWDWFRYPVLHFVLIGVTLFAVRVLWMSPTPEPTPVQREPIIITSAQVGTLRSDFARRWGTTPTAEQTSALIAQAVDEELLYREARVLALDSEDGSVRRRLVEKMRAVSDHPGRSPDELIREARGLGLDDDVVIRRLLVEKMRIVLAQDPTAPLPTEAELQAYLERHHDRFEQPAELTFSHVFLSETTRGEQIAADARAILSQLRPLSSPAALDLSDPFPLGLQLRAYSQGRIAARFGKPFAVQLFALEPGVWSEPIESPYGLHLVRVEQRSGPRLPRLADVRPRVVAGVEAERAAAQLARGMDRVRALYEIRVAGQVSTPAVTLASQARP